MSTSNAFDISKRVSSDGWDSLVHQRETVASFFPNTSASHLPVRFFSTSTTFNLFNSIVKQLMYFANVLI